MDKHLEMSDLPPRLAERARSWGGAEGSAWLADLPRLVDGIVARWDLVLGPPLDSHVSFTALVGRGTADAALTIPIAGDFAHVSGNLRFQEHGALRAWDGNAAVRLLEFDPPTGAMLIERCVPRRAPGRPGHPRPSR